MKRKLRTILEVASLCSAVALFFGCGGSGGSTTPTQTSLYTGLTAPMTINDVSVKDTLKGMSDLFPSCSATGVGKVVTDEQVKTVLSVVKMAQRMVPKVAVKKTGKAVALVPTTAPLTQTGACGGTLSYPTWSHLSGTTTLSVTLDNYCTVDIITGNKTTMNGTVSAVDAGTPSASGPVTTKITASIPSLAIVEKTASGTLVSSTTIAMTGFEYVPGTGATADISNLPGSVSLTSFEARAVENAKTTEVKVTNLALAISKSGTDSILSISGTICRGSTGCTTLSTGTPLQIDSSQNIKSGAISFTGAGGSIATLTAVSGTGQVFDVYVNGTLLPGAQLSCNGL